MRCEACDCADPLALPGLADDCECRCHKRAHVGVEIPDRMWEEMEKAFPYAVVDTKGGKPGERLPVLGLFPTEESASAFIETLPDHASGRYGLDGPERRTKRRRKSRK